MEYSREIEGVVLILLAIGIFFGDRILRQQNLGIVSQMTKEGELSKDERIPLSPRPSPNKHTKDSAGSNSSSRANGAHTVADNDSDFDEEAVADSDSDEEAANGNQAAVGEAEPAHQPTNNLLANLFAAHGVKQPAGSGQSVCSSDTGRGASRAGTDLIRGTAKVACTRGYAASEISGRSAPAADKKALRAKFCQPLILDDEENGMLLPGATAGDLLKTLIPAHSDVKEPLGNTGSSATNGARSPSRAGPKASAKKAPHSPVSSIATSCQTGGTAVSSDGTYELDEEQQKRMNRGYFDVVRTHLGHVSNSATTVEPSPRQSQPLGLRSTAV